MTIASTSGSIDFGDLLNTIAKFNGACFISCSWYFCWWSKSGTSNLIEFITIATLGNAQDFGDLSNEMDIVKVQESDQRIILRVVLNQVYSQYN